MTIVRFCFDACISGYVYSSKRLCISLRGALLTRLDAPLGVKDRAGLDNGFTKA